MKNRFGSVRENGFLYVFEHFVDFFKWPLVAILGAALICTPNFGFMTPANTRIVIMIILYAMLGMGLNVLIGYTGQVSLGHAGFYGIGAYVCALAMTKLGWPFWPSLLAAGLFAALVGLLLGLPTLRLSGTYLSIVTLGFCEIVQMILKQWESVTNGNYGIRNIPKPYLFGLKLDMKNGGLFYLALALCILTGLACLAIRNSKSGRAFMAIRDDELAATMMGIRTSRYKILAFVISAFITGIGGGIYCVIANSYIEPTSFVFNTSILILSVVIVGGLGTVRGMVFGSALLWLFPQVFRFLNEWRFVIYGVLLVLMMQFRPQGALGWQSTLPFRMSRAARKRLKERGLDAFIPGQGREA
ncbi:MAG: branched-chain amino acid ABC transporter permease [Clostridia bacterium]|nr:branched-chain amino acid ABC transporter permease [Clostridia bacterium]